MDYLHESGVSIYRRRRRLRAVTTLTIVILVLLVTVLYAASYVQGWVGPPAAKAVVNASCSNPALKPSGVTINVYNAANRTGLAASVARLLEKQGFKVATVDNDPLGKTLLGVGEVRAGESGAAGAILASKRVVGARMVQDDRMDASVDIVLGKKFKAVQVPRKVAVLKGAKPSPGC